MLNEEKEAIFTSRANKNGYLQAYLLHVGQEDWR